MSLDQYHAFVKSKDEVFHRNQIAHIDCKDLDDLIVRVTLTDGKVIVLEDILAVEAMMQIKPSVFEGRRFKYPKFMWLVHNIVGHPLMQILALFKFYKAAFWIHDVTVPRPLIKKAKR